MNVSEKGQDIRMREPNRAPQTAASTNLQSFLEQFLRPVNQDMGQSGCNALHTTQEGLLFKPQKG